jgi:dihydropteroate synthase
MTPPGRPKILGILNVTPDSFSDGGLWADQEGAIARGLAMSAEGADFVDVGGESTRPGAERPPVDAELERVIPVVEALSAEGVSCSIDTMRAEVARVAVESGAQLVNDVSGGLADSAMLSTVATLNVGYIAMHWRAHSAQMQQWAVYPQGVVNEVCAELTDRYRAAINAGIAPELITLDPGLGFAKTAEHNWLLLSHFSELKQLPARLLLGASRKSFLGALLADKHGHPRGVAGRESAHLAVISWLASQGVWGLRVHDVQASRDLLLAMTRLGALNE